MNKDQFFSVSEVASILGISREAVLKKIKLGKIKAERIGHIYAIPKRELGYATGETLSKKQKKTIEEGVKKTIKEYGEALKKLGEE